MPSLLDMPIEVRFLIYEHLLAGQKSSYFSAQPHNLRSGKARRYDRHYWPWNQAMERNRLGLKGVEILLVSKLCREESFQMLHLHANFDLARLANASWRLAPTKELSNTLNRIQYLSLSPFYIRGLETLFSHLTNLKLVKLSGHDFVRYYGGSHSAELDLALGRDLGLTQKLWNATLADISDSFTARHIYSTFPSLISQWDAHGRTFVVNVTGHGPTLRIKGLERFQSRLALVLPVAPGTQASIKLSDTPVTVEFDWSHAGLHRAQIIHSKLGKVLKTVESV
jgi:hypothetical protein